jgi:hypothetical protein
MSSVTLFLTRTPAHEFVYESAEELHLPTAPHVRGAPALPSVAGMGVNADCADDATRIKQFYMNDRQRKEFANANQKALDSKHPQSLLPTAQRERYSGRWGLLGMLIGPEVFVAEWGNATPRPLLPRMPSHLLNPRRYKPMCDYDDMDRRTMLFGGRMLSLITDDQPIIKPLATYRSMERHRNERGTGGYVALPQNLCYYEYKTETGNTVVAKLRSEHQGRCLRVTESSAGAHGLSSKQRAILIHIAPSIIWLTGCISVRPIGDDQQYGDSLPNPSARCFNEIYGAANAWGGGIARVFVLP